jgi:hypothetical protein
MNGSGNDPTRRVLQDPVGPIAFVPVSDALLPAFDPIWTDNLDKSCLL